MSQFHPLKSAVSLRHITTWSNLSCHEDPIALNNICLKWKNRELFLFCGEDDFFLPLCLPSTEYGTLFSERHVVFEALRLPRVIPCLFSFSFFFIFVLSGIQAAAMSVCGSESPPYPSKDLTWFQSEAISWTIGTCRSVCVPLIQPSSSSSLQLVSCWTGLKRWTAAGGPPDVGCGPKAFI